MIMYALVSRSTGSVVYRSNSLDCVNKFSRDWDMSRYDIICYRA